MLLFKYKVCELYNILYNNNTKYIIIIIWWPKCIIFIQLIKQSMNSVIIFVALISF